MLPLHQGHTEIVYTTRGCRRVSPTTSDNSALRSYHVADFRYYLPPGNIHPSGSVNLERVIGIEPTTASLATKNSTTELHPHYTNFHLLQVLRLPVKT